MSERIANANYPDDAESRQDGLWNILWDELKPFPDRTRMALRLAVACTAIVLVSNTFRLPLQDVLPFLVLFASKEEKVTTAITAVLVLFAITVAVGASILIFKYTGDRAEFRIPAMAVEIFVGMYLFRILLAGPVGFILAFIVSVSQSLVDLFPTPEEAVHQFLWVWAAVALSVTFAWVANLLLFPVAANQVLQRELVVGWGTVVAAATELTTGSPSAARRALRPLAKRGPTRLLKLLKLFLLEAPGLRLKQARLMRIILSLDKIAKLIFSYTDTLLKSPGLASISSAEKVILGQLTESAEHFEQEFAAGFVPAGATTLSAARDARPLPSKTESAVVDGHARPFLAEAQGTLEDLAGNKVPDEEPEPAAGRKKTLFVADAFSNPRHVQFALKVTLAGMLGYFFYTASDYFGIHTVYYTPLIIALASTGATVHKGVLRIIGCIIGGALGLICSVWLIPRFETLGMYLLIVFCLHGLAAWISAGSERISYIGLQIALAFDLGVLHDYGPPTSIDPLRDRFIGIILGVCIISIVFSLLWPEGAQSIAREKLAACLRAIASLVRLGGRKSSTSEREQLELEIGSRLSEANSYEEQATFEGLIYGSHVTDGFRLESLSAGVTEIYLACLSWLRIQTASGTAIQADGDAEESRERSGWLARRMEKLAHLLSPENFQAPISTQSEIQASERLESASPGDSANSDSGKLETLVQALAQVEVLLQAAKKDR